MDQVPACTTPKCGHHSSDPEVHPERCPTEQVLQLFIGAVDAQAQYLDKLTFGSAARVLVQQWPVLSPARCLWFRARLLTRSASSHQR